MESVEQNDINRDTRRLVELRSDHLSLIVEVISARLEALERRAQTSDVGSQEIAALRHILSDLRF